MTLLICPGFHPPDLTERFLDHLRPLQPGAQILVYPAHRYLPFNPLAVLHFLDRHAVQVGAEPLRVIGFSAGVVGSLGAMLSGRVQALLALDGWGVPLPSHLPTAPPGPGRVCRLSHDWFTHWSSHLLGGGESSFYADPSVAHLDLWVAPHQVQGWHLGTEGRRWRTTALEFLAQRL